MEEIRQEELKDGDFVLRSDLLADHPARNVDLLIQKLETLGFPLAKLITDEEPFRADPPEVLELTPIDHIPLKEQPLVELWDFLEVEGENLQVRIKADAALVLLHHQAISGRLLGEGPVYDPKKPVLLTGSGSVFHGLRIGDKETRASLTVDMDALSAHLRHNNLVQQDGVGVIVANAVTSFVNDKTLQAFEDALLNAE